MLNISNQFRILTAPDINTELNPANEILRFSDHLVWLENFIQTKFGEYSVLIEGNNLPELIHPVWTSASESGITLEIFNNQYNEISSRISKRKETLPLVVGAFISTFSSNFLTYINNTARLWQHQYNRSREWNIKPPEPKPEPVSELESEDSEEKEEDKVNLKPQEISYAKVTTKFKVRDKRNHSEESEQDSTSVDSQSVAKEKPMPFQIDYEKLAELLAPKIFELQQQHQKVSAYSYEVTDTNIDWSKPAKSYSH